MSTQPSAATGAAPSAAPAQNEAGEGTQHLPDPSKVRKGEAKLPSKIRPIPPKGAKAKVQLPGVDTGFDPASAFDQKIAKAIGRKADNSGDLDMGDAAEFSSRTGDRAVDAVNDAEQRAEKKMARDSGVAAERGPDGKFLKKGAAQGEEGEEPTAVEGEGEGEAPVETPEPPEGEEGEEAPEESVETLSTKYRDLEHKHKTLQGMFKPLQVRSQEILTEQHKAAKSATAWKAKADALQAEVNQLKSGTTPANQGAGGGREQSASAPRSSANGEERIQEIVKSIDWRMYAAVKEQGDDAAAVWLIQQATDMESAARKRDLDALREEMRQMADEPRRNAEQRQQVAQTATEIFNQIAQIKDENGEDAFPELFDNEKAQAIGKMWTQMSEQLGIEPHRAMTPAAIVQAILAYRFYHGGVPTSTLPPSTATPEGSEEGDMEEEEDDSADLNARPTRALVSGRPQIPSRRPTSAVGGDLAAQIKSAMRAGSESDNIFGFPVSDRYRRNRSSR